MWRALGFLCVLAVLAGCQPPSDDDDPGWVPDDPGDGGECLVPEGDYYGIKRYTSGDCPWADAYDGEPSTVSVGAGVACGPVGAYAFEEADGCIFETLIETTGDQNGLREGHATISTSCEDGFYCDEQYTISF